MRMWKCDDVRFPEWDVNIYSKAIYSGWNIVVLTQNSVIEYKVQNRHEYIKTFLIWQKGVLQITWNGLGTQTI